MITEIHIDETVDVEFRNISKGNFFTIGVGEHAYLKVSPAGTKLNAFAFSAGELVTMKYDDKVTPKDAIIQLKVQHREN